MNKDRKEYIVYRINVIRDLITNLRNDLDMKSIAEYNVDEDLWSADHRLCDSIKYIETTISENNEEK